MRRLIGGAFGLIYVVAGAGALPSPAAPVLRVLAIAAFVGLLITARRAITEPGDRAPEIAPFSRGYWIVAAAEAAAIAAGVIVLAFGLHAPRAFLGWVTLVVGVHFFGLAHVWKRRFYTWLGAVITACGMAGLAAAAAGAPAAVIAGIAAITPGVILLASSFLLIGRYRGGGTGAAGGGPGHAPPGAARDPKTARALAVLRRLPRAAGALHRPADLAAQVRRAGSGNVTQVGPWRLGSVRGRRVTATLSRHSMPEASFVAGKRPARGLRPPHGAAERPFQRRQARSPRAVMFSYPIARAAEG